MTFSQFAGTAIVPTLARVVLCTAFITVGANKLFNQSDFNAEQTTTLVNELGVDVEMKADVPPVDGNVSAQRWTITRAAFVQDEPAADPESNDDAPADAPNGEAEQDDSADEQPDVEVIIPQKDPPVLLDAEDDEAVEEEATEEEPVVLLGESSARAMHNVSLLLHGNDIPYPVTMAWIAALTEFVGGILLAIGLFSRIWGMGLAIAMAMAFYLTTMTDYFHIGPLDVAKGIGRDGIPDGYKLFNTVFSQLGLGVLALGIFFTGPGPLSLDRLIFGAKARRNEDDITIDT